MGKLNKAGIQFKQYYLEELVSDPNSCTKVINEVYHLAIHPFQLTNLGNSIKSILQLCIAKYNKNLDAIVLGFRNIKLLSNTGHINYDISYIHIDVRADFYLFRPEIGKKLQGVVTKKTKDHVSCLLYNVFNVSLPKYDKEDWLGHQVEIGQDIVFNITFTNFDYRFPYIRGEIITILSADDEGAPALNNKIKFEPEIEETPKCHPKKKHKVHVSFDENEDSFVQEEPVKKSKKKKKDKRNVDDSEELLDDVPLLKKHKKKKHRSNSVSETLECNNLNEVVDEDFKSQVKMEIDIEHNDVRSGDLEIEIKSKKKKHRSKEVLEIDDKPKVKIEMDSDQSSSKVSPKKSKKHKYKTQDINDTLEDFNFERLFRDPNVDSSQEIQLEQTEKKTTKRKRCKSTSVLQDISSMLPEDSDLEKIIAESDNDCKSKKKKTKDFVTLL